MNTSNAAAIRNPNEFVSTSGELSLTASTSRKVTFLVSHFPAGGAQEILANLAEGLAARGFEVHLLALYPLPQAAGVPRGPMAWSCIVDRKPRSVLELVGLLRALLRDFRNLAPHAVISAMPAANVLAVLAARFMAPKARLILTHHSPVETHNRALNFVDGWVGNWRNVSAVVSVSNTVAASLSKKPAAYLAKRRTIYNALPPRIEKQLSGLAIRRNGRHASARTIVATGRLTRQKNYPVLLRAAAHLSNVQVQIVGGGEDENPLVDLARNLGVAKQVHFLGRRSREETLNLLAAGDVFVQPSLFEGHSLALIEAAKLHLPLIVSNVPVQVEGVTAPDGTCCGILVDPADDVALAREITRLLDDGNYYARWTDRSRLLAESIHFGAMVAAYEDLLR